MSRSKLILVGAFATLLAASATQAGAQGYPNPFRPNYGWAQLPAGRKMGSTSSVYSTPVPADGVLYVVNRNQLYALAEGAGGSK